MAVKQFLRAQLPGSIFADEGVGKDDELSGDGDKGGFWRFSSCCETLIEGPHIDIEPSGAKGGKIKDAAHGRASTPNDPDAVTLA